MRHEFDMAYAGQTHAISVDTPGPTAGDLGPEAIQAAFDRAYAAAYGRTLDGVAARLLSVRTAVVGRRPRIDPRVFAPPFAGPGRGRGRGRAQAGRGDGNGCQVGGRAAADPAGVFGRIVGRCAGLGPARPGRGRDGGRAGRAGATGCHHHG